VPLAVEQDSHGCQTLVIAALEEDLRKYYPQEKASSKSKKGQGKAGKASSSSFSTVPPPLSMEDMRSKVDTARGMLNHVIELKLVSDQERRVVGLEPRPLQVFVADVLLSRSWLPAPATLTRETLLQSVHAYRGKDETLRVMARFLGLSDESPLPQIFWEAYLSGHGHKECFVAMLPAAPTSKKPKRETVLPLSSAVLLSDKLIDQLKLPLWCTEGLRTFETPQAQKVLISQKSLLGAEPRPGQQKLPQSQLDNRSKSGVAGGRGLVNHLAVESKPLVPVDHTLLPALVAWQKLQDEWKEGYQRFCEQNPPTSVSGTSDAPGSLGHYSEAMEDVLPPEIWKAIASQTNGAATYYRQVCDDQLSRELLGILDMETKGSEAAMLDTVCITPERWRVFRDMCSFAWGEVAPTVDVITTTRANKTAHVLHVRAEGGRGGGGGMGAPFGLSI